MRYYLILNENRFTLTCYSNYELLLERKINPILNVVNKITDKHYTLFDFETLSTLHIRANAEFYYGYSGQPIKISFNSFITTLKDIINCEKLKKGVNNNEKINC